jgi:hypothetical protein
MSMLAKIKQKQKVAKEELELDEKIIVDKDGNHIGGMNMAHHLTKLPTKIKPTGQGNSQNYKRPFIVPSQRKPSDVPAGAVAKSIKEDKELEKARKDTELAKLAAEKRKHESDAAEHEANAKVHKARGDNAYYHGYNDVDRDRSDAHKQSITHLHGLQANKEHEKNQDLKRHLDKKRGESLIKSKEDFHKLMHDTIKKTLNKEEVELDESVFADKEQAQSVAAKLKSKFEDGNYSVVADKDKHRVVHSYHSDSRVKKDIAKLNEEQIDEKSDQAKQNKIMKNMMDASRGARYKLNNPVPDAETEHKTARAQNVAIGRALRNEDAEQLEESPIEGARRKFSGMYNAAPAGTFAADKAASKKKNDVPFDGPYTKTKPAKNSDGTAQSPMSRARALAKDAMKKQMKEEVELEEGYDKSSEHHKNARKMAKDYDGKATFHPNGHAEVRMRSIVHGYSTLNPKGTTLMSGEDLAIRASKEHGKGKVQGNVVHFKEAKDEEEYGYEGDMAMNQLATLTRCAEMIKDILKPDTDLPEWVQSKITLATDYIVTAADYLHSELEEQAPVAPVPDRKYIKGTPEHKAYKATKKPINGMPTNVKETFDADGNIINSKVSYKEFAMMLEYETKDGRYVHKGSYGGTYVDPEGADDADDKKPKQQPAEKRGRGRPAGAKSGARKITGTSKLFK